MKKETKRLETELQELFIDFDDDILAVSDFEITASQGTPITHITNGSTDGDFRIGLWCGDPQDDDNSEEMIVSEEERINIYKEIIELL